MKKIFALIMASALLLPQLHLYANEEHHPEKQGVKEKTEAQGGMMGKMEQQMQKMMRQMDEIRKTDDPAKRKKLLQEHMQSMHEGMAMMRNMHGGGNGGMMMGQDMHKGGNMMGCGDQEMRHQQRGNP